MSLTIGMSSIVEKGLKDMMEEVMLKSVRWCGDKYNFDTEEAIRELCGVLSLSLSESGKEVKEKREKREKVEKGVFPFPYNGELNESQCYALRANNGLYTQCTVIRPSEKRYCKSCESQMLKKGLEKPELGTIEDRKAVGILEYVDPKGRKPTAYTKIMKKLNLTKEQVLEEASKRNIEIDEVHFEEPDMKRGRPSSKDKEEKVKGPKGRPKKSKKVIEVEGNEDDLFAALVAEANTVEGDSDEESNVSEKSVAKEQKKEAERQEREAKKEAERQEREAKKEAERQEREAKKEAERQEREAKKEAERQEREAKKKALEEQKAAKKAEAEAAKAAKEAAKAEKEAAKAAKSAGKPAAKVEAEDEPDVVKKIEFEGKKYLKSKKTGIVYDYEEYVKNNDQVVVGKWSDEENKIIFNKVEEESEEEEEEYEV